MPPTWLPRTIAVWLALPALAAAAAAPEPPAPRPIGVGEAVRIALENNPLLEAATQNVGAAEAERKLAGTGYYPRLDFTEDFARSDNPVFVFASKLGQEKFQASDFDLDALNRPDPFSNFATRFVLQQNIWDAGQTGHGKRAASAGISASRHARQRTEDEVVFETVQAFWSLTVAQEMLVVARDAENAARANVALATELVDAGLAVASDRMAAEVRLAEVEAMRIRAETGLEVARAALVRAMGLADSQAYAAAPPAGTPPVDGRGVTDHVEDALATRPDLLALDQRIRQAEIGVGMAKSRRMPRLGAGATYEWNGDTPFGSDGDNWAVGIGVRVPVFDGLDTSAYVARARAGLAEASSMRTAMQQGVRLQVQAAWAERESALRRYEVAEAALSRSREALRIVRERYGEGMALMVELLAAEAAETQARATLVSARGEWWLAQAALDLATGRTPAGTGATAPDTAGS
jgi:outer membrane protein TolC